MELYLIPPHAFIVCKEINKGFTFLFPDTYTSLCLFFWTGVLGAAEAI
jgi:hypothetical protein